MNDNYFMGLMVFLTLVGLSLIGGGVYVMYHFIAKLW